MKLNVITLNMFFFYERAAHKSDLLFSASGSGFCAANTGSNDLHLFHTSTHM